MSPLTCMPISLRTWNKSACMYTKEEALKMVLLYIFLVCTRCLKQLHQHVLGM